MDFGLFLEFPRREGITQADAFDECFELADKAEALGVDSLWLAEYTLMRARIVCAGDHRQRAGDPHEEGEDRLGRPMPAPWEPGANRRGSGDPGPHQQGAFGV